MLKFWIPGSLVVTAKRLLKIFDELETLINYKL